MEMQKRLYEAAIEGDVKTLQALIKEDPLTLDRVHVSTFHDTPLHVAVLRGHLEFARAVLSHNPRLACAQDVHGNTPLHVAASACRHVEIARELLRHAESCSACMVANKDGKVPLQLALMRGGGGGGVDLVNELTRASSESTRVRGGRGESVYHLCAEYGNLEGLKVLMDESDGIIENVVNVRDDNGNTPLHLAAYHKNLEMIKYLLSRTGIDPNATNNRGETALNLVENSPRDIKALEVINFLLQSNVQRGKNEQIITTLATPQEQNRRPRTRSKNKSWKKFFTFNDEVTNKLEQMRGALFIASAIVVVINILPVLFIEIHYRSLSSSNDLVGDFSMSAFSLWSALIVMTILLSGFPLSNPICAWFVVQFTYTMLALLGLYFVASLISNENHYVNVNTPAILIFVWFLMLLLATLLNLIRLLAWFVKIVKGNAKRKQKNARELNPVLKA